NLNNVDSVPADATGLLIIGPKADYSEREIKLISDFWNQKKGRLFVLIGAHVKTPRLNEFLAQQGVTPQGDRVLKTGTVLAQDETGAIGRPSGIIASPAAKIAPQGKEVTKDIAGFDTQLLGPTQSLALDQSKSTTDKVKFTPILESGEGFWGEMEYTPGESG